MSVVGPICQDEGLRGPRLTGRLRTGRASLETVPPEALRQGSACLPGGYARQGHPFQSCLSGSDQGAGPAFYVSLLDPMQNESGLISLGTKMKKVVLVSLAVSVAFNLFVVWMLW
jgi:hypothetical protein